LIRILRVIITEIYGVITMRKGMLVGSGKRGYKNIISNDPSVHSQSSKGIKQPQKVNGMFIRQGNKEIKVTPAMKHMNFRQLQKKGVFLRYQGDADKDGVKNIKDCKPLDKRKQDNILDDKGSEMITEVDYDKSIDEEIEPTKLEKFKGQTEALALRGAKAGKSAYTYGMKKWAERQEESEERRMKALGEVDHPLIKKLKRQEKRVEEIKRQLAELPEGSDREDRLFEELEEEEDQLRQLEEDVTDIEVTDLSDAQLKTLSIRQGDSGFSFFGSGNEYESELLRRIDARKELNQKIKEAQKKPVETGVFKDLF
jgi:hypothetical protein